MTILEQLAATTDPAWVDMINRRRPSIVDDGVSEKHAAVSSQRGTTWGRKGGTHYKDGEFHKK